MDTTKVPPAPQEYASATEALRTNGIRRASGFEVLHLQMHLRVALVDTVAKGILAQENAKPAQVVLIVLQ